jgi:hypothetical protein
MTQRWGGRIMPFVTRQLAALLIAFCMAAPAASQPVNTRAALQLLARHEALQRQLQDNPFGRPLHLQSSHRDSRLSGDIYVQIAHPFAVAGEELRRPATWCDILILHLNIKACHVLPAPSGDTLDVYIGRKSAQPASSAQPVALDFDVVASSADYLRVVLHADEGPLGTSDYRIALEAAPLDAASSVLHLSYSYHYGTLAKLAMNGYLSTAGRHKVGFSVTGYDDNGEPEYTRGMRAVVERNTMRYYLAIEAYLRSLAIPPANRTQQRLRDWFDATEQYARQLHEIGRDEYIAMKQQEIRRQYLATAHN